MDAHRRDQAPAPRRHRAPGIVGLELWDLPVRGETLFAARTRPDFDARLAEAVAVVRTGALHPAGRAVDFLYVGGGGVARPGLGAALDGTGLPWRLSPDGAFVGEAGGLALGGPGALVLDVGQSALKLSWLGGRLQMPRDFTLLPVGAHADGRARLRRFLIGALRRVPFSPSQLIVALPSEIDDALVPSGSSYPGLAGDARLVADVLDGAGLALPALVLNDAELAALSARLVAPPEATTLVLTVGFGVGAALARPLEKGV